MDLREEAKDAKKDLTFYFESMRLDTTGSFCSTAILNASHEGFNDLSTVLRLLHKGTSE